MSVRDSLIKHLTSILRASQGTILVTLCDLNGLSIAKIGRKSDIDINPNQITSLSSAAFSSSEESWEDLGIKDQVISFSSYLITHNTKVSIFSMALGMTWGVGTVILLLYNGIILGAISLDYIISGETVFLLGWLLPHGAIEIPAILLASQAGLVLAGALIGWENRSLSIKIRLRKTSGDIVTLISGAAIMLVWAGIIEAFLSQYHEPVIPYEAKIGFGVFEIVLLATFLWKSGRKTV